jgi:hypothetical protein
MTSSAPTFKFVVLLSSISPGVFVFCASAGLRHFGFWWFLQSGSGRSLTLSRFSVPVAKLRDLPTSPILGIKTVFHSRSSGAALLLIFFLFFSVCLLFPLFGLASEAEQCQNYPFSWFIVSSDFFSVLFDQSIQTRFFSEW